MLNVTEVDCANLCLECGTCIGACPFYNISMVPDMFGRNRIVVEDQSTCKHCIGYCLKVCPGHEIDMDALNRAVFGKLPSNYWAGNYKQAYIGSYNDLAFLRQASSGGIVSGILIHALKENIIDGVYLLQPNPNNPLVPVMRYAISEAEVKKAAGSIYWPAPVGQVIRDIRNKLGRYAFVGLPCEIQALRKTQGIFSSLQGRIVFSIGLFCGGRTTIAGQKFTLERYGFKPESLSEIRYRGGDWPGTLSVCTKDGKEFFVPKSKQIQGFGSQLIAHPRCVFCHDSLADLADISAGDAWRLEHIRLPHEKSVLIVRTEAGLSLIEGACAAKRFALREIEIEKVIHSQLRPLMHKKQALWDRIAFGKLICKKTPSIVMERPILRRPSVGDYLSAAKVVVLSLLTNLRLIRSILKRVPLQILSKHSFFDRYSKE